MMPHILPAFSGRRAASGISLEQALVLFCSHPEPDADRIESANALLGGKVDWPLLHAVSIEHKVFPIVYSNLSRFFPGLIPGEVSGEFRKAFLRISAANHLREMELAAILDSLERVNITVVPFKGPLLTRELFGDSNLRTYVDLDLLVAKGDLRPSIMELMAMDFRFDIDLDPEQYLHLAAAGHHANLVRGELPTMVEVHWEMTGRYLSQKMGLEDVAPRLRKVRFLEREVLSLSPEDLLIYLSIHGNRMGWAQLDSILCVAALLRKEKNIDWNFVREEAGRYGALKMVLLGCLLARELYGVDLESNIAGQIDGNRTLRNTGEEVIKHLFPDTKEMMRRQSYWQKLTYHWKMLDKAADRIRFCFTPVFRPTHSDWMWLPLPARFSWLYLFLRPLRLIGKYAWKILGR
ncbi:MAG: hypothetical protein Kow0089_17030 [Desulfobulbaceae bacterium]